MKRRRRSNSVPGHVNNEGTSENSSSSPRPSSRRISTASPSNLSSSAARTSGILQITSENFDSDLVGIAVPPHARRAGKYLLGKKLEGSPVKSIVQCLARLENSDKYYQVKLLTLFSGNGRHIRDETQDEKQGKMLLHTEHSLLSLLSGMEGVVQKHDFFTEMCLMEELSGKILVLKNDFEQNVCITL